MNPFDPKSALLAKHAQHVVLIHFPIALCFAGVAFDFLAQWRKKKGLAQNGFAKDVFAKNRFVEDKFVETKFAEVAYYNLLIAAVMTVPVLASGLLAWRWQLEGQPLKGILRLHLMFGILSSALIWLVWWLHHHASKKPAPGLPAVPLRLSARLRLSVPLRLSIEAVSAAVVALTAHLGGFLSGVNGGG